MSSPTRISLHRVRSVESSGFTIIELLVVIIVIGILAAITIIAYGGIQVRANTAALQSDIRGAAAQLAADDAITGLYPATMDAANGGKGLKASPHTSFEYNYVALTNAYCLTASSSRAGVPAYMITHTGANPTEGVCPGHTGGPGGLSESEPTAVAAGCFSVSGNTITGYRSYEHNNSSNPACPRDVVLPTAIGGTQITSIGSAAFREKNLTSLTLSSSITSIQSSAFRDNNLTTLTIPNTVTSIGSSAFRENQLTTVTLSSSITSLASEVFRENKITTVTIPSAVTSISSDAFRDNRLSSVAVPAGANVASGAFDSGVAITRY